MPKSWVIPDPRPRARRRAIERDKQREQTFEATHQVRELKAQLVWEAVWPAELTPAEASLRGLAPAGVSESQDYLDEEGRPVEVEHWLPCRRGVYNRNGPRYVRLKGAPGRLVRQDDFPGLADKVTNRITLTRAPIYSRPHELGGRPDEVVEVLYSQSAWAAEW